MSPPLDPQGATSNLTRRDFVRASAVAAAGAAAGACASATGPVTPTARVAAVRGTDLASMTVDVLDALGGIGSVVHDGETVFIKPNMVTLPAARTRNVFAAGECTKPEIVIAVAEACLQAGASEVTIGDGSHALSLPWTLARTLDGSRHLAGEAARLSSGYGRTVRVASLEAESPGWVEVPSGTYLGTIAVSSLLTDADRVISIPVAKTHSWAQLTLALKNFVGVTPMARYGDIPRGIFDRGVVFDHSTPRAIASIYLDVVEGVRPDLAIVDFSIGVEGDGPTLGHGGRTVDMRQRLGSWLLLASTDLVAADATAARIMRHAPERPAQLAMGYERGMGEIREDRIELLGEQLDRLRVPWASAGVRTVEAMRAAPVSATGNCAGSPCRSRSGHG
ncbi:MAG: DUF362 domain-containing protein [Gemmatimonadales bacterium]|nr:DUF362 domain-containing protein [Gemmatimonadales bacterium]